MPELPDVTVYVERLSALTVGQLVVDVRLLSPFFLRTAVPPIGSVKGREVLCVRRLGKRIVFDLNGDLHLVMHLMVAGRLHWHEGRASIPKSHGLAAVDFPAGTLTVTEAGTRKRASLHLVQGQDSLFPFDRHGLEVLESTEEQFRGRLALENHTVKRALTDPWLFSGIGNAYSDEILHRARMSPFVQTSKMTAQQVRTLYTASRAVLREWLERLRAECGNGFPAKVTAFRDEMAVHGKFGRPCPVCGTPIQRIRYADNETNYCPECQTGGLLLADRGLSRLLKKDWPRSLEELENMKERQRKGPAAGRPLNDP